MPLEQEDLDQISAIVDASASRVTADVDSRIQRAQFGGPTVQVVPSDLVYLGNGSYVSESTERVYRKGGNARLIDMGPIPQPI